MNRGYDGNDIFVGNQNKSQFLEYLEGASNRMKIRLFAYCVMDNHYHLVLENSSGMMSDFLKLLNGLYGMYYRKMYGGKGYVFQSRFKSNIRQRPIDQSIGVQRKDDRYFEPLEKVLWEFKNIHGVNVEEIETWTWVGKRQRGELLVLLRDKAGLKYKDISNISVFSNLSFTSLGSLYRRTKKAEKERINKDK